jgi:dihydrofolate reductase
MCKKYIIVAMCENNGIGIHNELPWHIPEDMKHFINVTLGKTVVMGKNTWLSIPEKNRPLRKRFNIVLTKYPTLMSSPKNNVVFTRTDEVDDIIKSQNKDCFIIGGGEIYNMFLPLVDGLYVTRIKKEYECDIFFPKFDDKFKLVHTSNDLFCDREKCFYSFEYYERNLES